MRSDSCCRPRVQGTLNQHLRLCLLRLAPLFSLFTRLFCFLLLETGSEARSERAWAVGRKRVLLSQWAVHTRVSSTACITGDEIRAEGRRR